ncbi:methyl-accepting chemotaxis protein [Vibrio alginolyticus]
MNKQELLAMGEHKAVSGGEVELTADANLISTTAPTSIVTYANDSFCNVANYPREELVGKPHNVVRHPDMPKAAFKQVWQTIQSGRSWMGLVKNARKGGGFYWVSAFITPVTDAAGNIIEYQSVRTKPEREWIKRADSLYSHLRKDKLPTKLKLPRFSFSWGRYLAAGITVASSIAVIAGASPILCGAASLLAMAGMALNEFFHHRRLKQVQKVASSAYDNPLMEWVYTGRYDDYSVIDLAIHKRTAEIRAIVGRATETSKGIQEDAQNELSNQEEIKDNLAHQGIETDSVATAVTEMAHSIRDVANNAVEASALVDQVNQLSDQGSENVDQTIDSVADLHEALEEAKVIINDLSASSKQIETILEVISSIADQTNLLALNAAIEAARAGESGRGFAVVADEVRTLASKTQSSTEEIQSMISHLQNTANLAVNAMDHGSKLSDICRDKAVGTGEVLKRVNTMLGDVTSTSHQIAAAVDQQATVTEDINRNVTKIKQLSESNIGHGEASVNRTGVLVSKLEELQRLMVQFQKH